MSTNGISIMKRQFLKVKEIAGQTFQRSEKTELLTDELTVAEKRVELIRQSCQNSGKKLSSCMQRLAVEGASSDRRSTKKIPEAQLAQCMEEWGLNLGEGSVLGMTMVDCARVQDALASDLLAYKLSVEEAVVEPLQNILKTDIANVAKCRKQLAKLTSDMDAAKLRLQAATKNCQQASNSNLPAAISKADTLKEESEEAAAKVDQCRDMLATEMFNLISREPELSRLFVRQCQLQLEYHKAAYTALESVLPELEIQIENCPYHPVFGVPLEDHLRYSNREIAIVIETCICLLLDRAMDEEGLFRIGGSVTKIKKMKSAFDANVSHLIEDERDPHNLAGVLKLYLRSLPDPLLTYSLYNEWMGAARIRDHNEQLLELYKVVYRLPKENFKNLRYLMKFLSKLCKNSEKNKMSSQNLAIVMGPNLLWSPVSDAALGMNMTATNMHSAIVDSLITYADWFFPADKNNIPGSKNNNESKEFEFHVSTPISPRNLNGFLSSLRDSQLSLSTTKLSNGDSAVDSLSSSPTNSPKSPSPRVVTRTKKKAPVAPRYEEEESKFPITRSMSCGIFQPNGNTNRDVQFRKLSQQSQSHENLLSANYCDVVASSENRNQKLNIMDGSSKCVRASTYPTKKSEIIGYNSVPVIKPARSKHRAAGLPPLLEKSVGRKERPSFPPPEVPVNVTRKETEESTMKHTSSKQDIVDISDVNMSFESKKTEATISFMDDSDFEEEKLSKSLQNSVVSQVSTQGKIVIGADTPKWFDHYDRNRRPSDAVWYASDSSEQLTLNSGDDSVFSDPSPVESLSSMESHNDTSSPKNIDHEEQYRTVISVGGGEQSVKLRKNRSDDDDYIQHKVSQPKNVATIKLKVSGDNQDTRL